MKKTIPEHCRMGLWHGQNSAGQIGLILAHCAHPKYVKLLVGRQISWSLGPTFLRLPRRILCFKTAIKCLNFNHIFLWSSYLLNLNSDIVYLDCFELGKHQKLDTGYTLNSDIIFKYNIHKKNKITKNDGKQIRGFNGSQ